MLASSFLDCAGQKCMSLSSKVREELRIDDGKMRVIAEVVEAPQTRLFIRCPFVPLRNYMYVGCLFRLEDLGPRVGASTVIRTPTTAALSCRPFLYGILSLNGHLSVKPPWASPVVDIKALDQRMARLTGRHTADNQAGRIGPKLS